jgi:hypothetical protein
MVNALQPIGREYRDLRFAELDAQIDAEEAVRQHRPNAGRKP